MNKFHQLVSAVAATALLTLGTAHAELPVIKDARIIQPPPGSKVAAAYFTISNTADEPLIITGASSEVIPMVEVHLSFVENDVAKMEEQESVTVEAGDSLEFKHGSYHIMLMGLKESLSAGSDIPVVLETSAGSIDISVPVITPDAADSMKAHKTMKHEGMEMKGDAVMDKGMKELSEGQGNHTGMDHK